MNLRKRISDLIARQDSHVVDVVRGASIAGILKILSGVLQFALNVVLGRALGVEGAGVYFLALTTTTIAATIGRVGLDSSVVRFVSARATANEWTKVRAVVLATIVIGTACSIVIAIVLLIGTPFLAESLFSEPRLIAPMRIMAIATVPLAFNVLISRALQGLSDIRDSILVFSIIPTGMSLAGTWLLARSFGVNGATAAYVAAVTISAVYGGVAWRRALAPKVLEPEAPHSRLPLRELLASGPPLLIGALLQLVIQMSGTLLLGIWGSAEDVSLFAVAWRTALLINLVLLAVNAIAQPKFASLYARGDMVTLAKTARRVTILMTLCATPPFLCFALAPSLVMSAFGVDFVPGSAALQILSAGQFINVATGSVGVLLVMCGQERDYRNVQMAAACVVLIFNYLLTPTFGVVGAATAAAVALIVQNALFAYFVWTRLGILLIGPQSTASRFRR